MPHIMVVHDEQEVRDPLITALRADGHEVSAFDRSIPAWDALTPECAADLLITRVRFPDGPHGVAPARRAHMNRKHIHVLFVASPEMERYTDGLGVLSPTPTSPLRVTELAAGMLQWKNEAAA